MRSTDLETDVAHMFAADVTGHRLIVRHDAGIYRHLVFQSREHSWNNRFELITAPGSLTITGDRGSHTFRRDYDMFSFFRCNPDRPHRINASYWAEKLPNNGREVQKYSEQAARVMIKQYLDEAVEERDELRKEFDEENARQLESWAEDLRAEGIEQGDPDYPPPTPEREKDWPELVAAEEKLEKAYRILSDAEYDGALAYDESLRPVLRELEEIGLVGDTWEWDLTDYDFHFLWCLHAIAWGIQQYDKAVRSGLHKIRTAPMEWDTPLPTDAPTRPDRQQVPTIDFMDPPEPRPARPQMITAEITGGVL
jgi:hypothetical protein